MHGKTRRVKLSASSLLIWAVQVAVAILLLPALLIVLVITGVAIVILWLTSVFKKLIPLRNRSEEA